jgi:hypothetical protein
MKIAELLSESISFEMSGSYIEDPDRFAMMHSFVKWVSKKIGLTDIPHIEFSNDHDDAQNNHHTGSFDWGQGRIWVYVKNRNMVDCLRTLCHELVHAKQHQDGRITGPTKPGSPLEAESDQIAGYLIKLWGARYNQIFEQK